MVLDGFGVLVGVDVLGVLGALGVDVAAEAAVSPRPKPKPSVPQTTPIPRIGRLNMRSFNAPPFAVFNRGKAPVPRPRTGHAQPTMVGLRKAESQRGLLS